MSQESTFEAPDISGIVGSKIVAYRRQLVQITSVVVGVVLWQLYAAGQPAYLFPELTEIVDALFVQLNEENLFGRFFDSLTTLFTGYLIAAAVGIALGLAMGLNRWLEIMLNPYINAFYVAPIAALVPIIILIGGPSFTSRVFVVFIFAVFEITFNTYEGVKSVPDELVDAARSFGGGRWFVLRNVVIPHDLPYIFAGLRLGIGRAVIGMILAELLVEFSNLGALIRNWQNTFRIAGVFSVVILLMALGITLTYGVSLLRNHFLDWQQEGEP